MAEQLAEALAAAIGGGFSKVALYPMDMCGRHPASPHTPRAPTVSLVHRSVWAYIQTYRRAANPAVLASFVLSIKNNLQAVAAGRYALRIDPAPRPPRLDPHHTPSASKHTLSRLSSAAARRR